MTPPREASVRRAVVAYLRSLAPAVAYRSNPPSPYDTAAGDPDIIASVGGWLVALELKRPGWRAADGWRQTAQARRLHAWQASGAIVAVVTSVGEARAVVEPVLRSAAAALNAAPAVEAWAQRPTIVAREARDLIDRIATPTQARAGDGGRV